MMRVAQQHRRERHAESPTLIFKIRTGEQRHRGDRRDVPRMRNEPAERGQENHADERERAGVFHRKIFY